MQEQIKELQQENESFRAEQDRKSHQDLIRQGVREGKITPATESWWQKLSHAELAEHLKDAPVIIPQGTLSLSAVETEKMVLTEEDKAVCRHFGFTEEEFRTHKTSLYQ